MHRILLIEDSTAAQLIVKETFQQSCLVTVAGSLGEARKQLDSHTFELILLDVQLPDGDGFKFLASLRSQQTFSEIPVLMLTGRNDIQDKVMGFSLGAEDYVVKPFDPLELKARVEARLNRRNKNQTDVEVFRKGSLLFSIAMQKLTIVTDRETPVDLTPIEFKLLLYFARHEEHVLSRDRLIEAVWGNRVHIVDRTIDTHVSNLRKKIQGCEFRIKAVHGIGYTFKRGDDKAERDAA
jgi:DNA-binding response OmpR family regulator